MWQLAELTQDHRTSDRMSRLLYRDLWEADAARDRLEQFVIKHSGYLDGIGVLDEIRTPKKGTYSVGVGRHDCGTAGTMGICQVATP